MEPHTRVALHGARAVAPAPAARSCGILLGLERSTCLVVPADLAFLFVLSSSPQSLERR
jgi:hypothetical protein